MTAEPVELAELLTIRDRLIAEVQEALSPQERQSLLSIAKGEPEWSLLEIEHLQQMPAIRWKLQNLQQLAQTNPVKFRAQASELAQRLTTPVVEPDV